MGKTHSGILQGASGKVGGVVARKGRNGKTILATYQPNVKNPQTNKQMAQRIILATVGQAVSYLTPIIDHSWEGVAVGALSKEYFRKRNLAQLRSKAAYAFNHPSELGDVFMTTKNVNALIPNAYIISKGSLGNPRCKVVQGTAATDGNTPLKIEFPTSQIQATGTGTKEITMRQLMQALFGFTDNNDQLTLVCIQKTGTDILFAYEDAATPGDEIALTGMKAMRMYIDGIVNFDAHYTVYNSDAPITDLNGLIADLIDTAFESSDRTDEYFLTAISDYFRSSTNVTVAFDSATNVLSITPLLPFDINSLTMDSNDEDLLGYVYSAGIIRSHQNEDATWKYSNAVMVNNTPSESSDTNFGLAWRWAIPAWFKKVEIATDELYLQAGTNRNRIGEDFT